MNYDEFLSPVPVAGTYVIKNLTNGRVFLSKSEDLVKTYKDERFRLDMGMHSNKELQKEYTEMGLELFQITLDERKKDGESLNDLLSRRRKEMEEEGIAFY